MHTGVISTDYRSVIFSLSEQALQAVTTHLMTFFALSFCLGGNIQAVSYFCYRQSERQTADTTQGRKRYFQNKLTLFYQTAHCGCLFHYYLSKTENDPLMENIDNYHVMFFFQ